MKTLNCPHCASELVGEEGTLAVCPLCQSEVEVERQDAELRQVLGERRLVLCPDCGKEISSRANTCPGCGAPQRSSYAPMVAVQRPKSRAIYITLAFFLGLLGVHNFYAGHRTVACIQLTITLLLGWFVVPLLIMIIWVIRDIFQIKKDGLGIPFGTN